MKSQPDVLENDDRVNLNSNKPHVSELSNQVRSLQHMNYAQAASIDKLERKLNILADLKGVSVMDLSSVIQSACKGEAHSELQAEVEMLRAQLNIARSDDALPNRHPKQSVDTKKDSNNDIDMQRKLLTLEDALKEESARAAELELACSRYEQQLQECKKTYDDAQQELKREHNAIVNYLQDQFESKEILMMQVSELSKRELALRHENEHALSAIGHLKNQLTENAKHKEAQHKEILRLTVRLTSNEEETTYQKKCLESKISIQSQQIKDLEQQLSSLTMALNLERAERENEFKSHMALKENLSGADSEVAFFHHHMRKKALERSNEQFINRLKVSSA